MGIPMLLYATWARPSTQTLIVCVVVFALAVGLGQFLWRRSRHTTATILFFVSIPWGFALALFVLNQIGVMHPYEADHPVMVDAAGPNPMGVPLATERPLTERPLPTAAPTQAAP